MARGSLLVSLVVSTVMWFVGDWLGDLFWPNEPVNSFLFAVMFAILGGGIAVAFFTVRRGRRLRAGRW